MSTMNKVPLTREGHKKLKEELNHLKTVERQAVIKAISEARAHGDLSENAEYDAAKNRQSFIEGRINYLSDRLARAEVIDAAKFGTLDRIKFGAYVTLSDEDSGEEVVYQLVGEDEADIENGKLSISAPLSRALLGKELDDEVVFQTPSGRKTYVVLDIATTAP